MSRTLLTLTLVTVALCCGFAAAGAQTEPLTAAGAAAAEGEALIQPGDQIVLGIWREPDLSGTFTVDASGVVTLPRVGAVDATALTGAELQDSVHQVLTRYLRNPSIEIRVLRRVGVQGEVLRPGLYMVDLTTTLREVISEAGGITEFGNPNRISIVREGERIPVGEGAGARFVGAELRSGDQVMVGRRSWFELNSLAIVSTAAVVVSVAVPLLRSAF